MLGGTLALTARALRVSVRTRRTFVSLLVFVGVLYISVASYSGFLPTAIFGAPGLRAFQTIAQMNLIAITLGAVSIFATAITEEKEEQTLGLLRMAGLNPVSILAGKLVPRLVIATIVLFVQLPFTFLAITLGGVTRTQVLSAYLALAAYLFLVANLGLLASVVARRSVRAVQLMVLLLVIYLLGPFLILTIGVMILRVQPPGFFMAFVGAWSDTSIFSRMTAVLETGFGGPTFEYQFFSNLIGGLICFVLAWIAFPHFTLDDGSEAPARPAPARVRGSRGVRPAWSNPLAWKDFHFLAGGRRAILIKLILYPCLGMVIPILTDPTLEVVAWSIWGTCLAGFIVESTFLASRIFREEISRQTLSSLVILPWTLPSLAWSKVAGCAIALTPAIFWMIAAMVLQPDEFAELLVEAPVEPAFWMLVASFVFFLHFVALLSLTYKWGSIPIAFAVTYMAPSMFGACAFFIGEAFIYVLLILAAVGSAILHVRLGTRLEAIAAQ